MPRPTETPKKNNSLRDFQGVNTQAARQVIGDNQFAWLENVMPIGFGNAVTVPGPSAPLATWTGTAYHLKSVNVAGVDYEIVLLTNGAVYAVNLVTNVSTSIAAAGTLSGSGSEVAQWQNSQAIIVDPTKGYFSWDGTTFTKQNGLVQSLSVSAIGVGYTSSPTLAFSGGGGTGAAGTSHIQVGLVTLSAAGTGYNVGDTVTILGGTFATPAQIRVAAVGTGGAITGLNLLNSGDYTVAPGTVPATSTSPYGSGATFVLNFGIGPVTLTAGGAGYTSAPTVTVSGGGGTGGQVTANPAVVPSGGTAVATYAGRVWVASNRTVAFSAPSSYSDFSSTTGGGSFIVSDETLHSNIVQLVSANNFLYILGNSSVNVVADVSISGGVTVFSNTNISASIGTNQPYSVIPYYRALWFAAPYGFYALYGSTTQKASDDLDGIFPLITNAIKITTATAVIKNIICLCFMFKYADPVAGPRTLLAVFFNKKWFFCSQGDSLIHIDSAIVGGIPVLYATDGSSLYSLFNRATFPVNQTIITKLWDMGNPLIDKQSIKFGLEVLNPFSPQTISGTIDTEIPNSSVPLFLNNAPVIWTNNSLFFVQWKNNSSSIVNWIGYSYAILTQDVQNVGRYLGITLNGSALGSVYQGLHLQYEERARWSEGGPQ